MNKVHNQFSIEVSSDLDYEKMVVNIYCENNQIAIMSCDRGVNQVEIKLFDSHEDKIIWSLDYQSFFDILKLASEKLKGANGCSNKELN